MVGKTSMLLLSSLTWLSALATVATACQKQSCDIADISGSSGKPFDIPKAMKIKAAYPASSAPCIESYYYKFNMPVPKGYTPSTRPPPGYNGKGLKKRHWNKRHWRRVADPTLPYNQIKQRDVEEAKEVHAPVEKRQACKENAFFFARGTMEPALTNNMGMSVGGNLQSGLEKAMPGKWYTQGVKFDAALFDNFCVGLPGGYNCVQQVNKYHQQCPNTKIAFAGFSQGAMVVRNCAAFVNESAKRKITAVVGIGDPFNGAPVKGVSFDRVKSICYSQDGVCGGELSIGLFHGAYMMDNSVSSAVNFIVSKSR